MLTRGCEIDKNLKLGGEPIREIWMVLGCVILSLGFIVWLVLQGVRPPSVPLVWCLIMLCEIGSSEKWFCEILEDPWWFLDEFR